MRGMVIYCERSSTGFWEEPFNALTSIVFIVAAVAAWQVYRGLRPPADGHLRWELLLMLGALVAAGAGGFLWHTLAPPWAEWADVIPVLVFVNLYLVSLLYRGAGLGTPAVLVVFLAFQGAMAVAGGRFQSVFLVGTGFYVPVVAMLCLAAVYSAARLGYRAWPAAAGAVMFGIAVGLRAADLNLCPAWPAGTHFLWHLFSGAAFYLMFLGLGRLIDAAADGAVTARRGAPGRAQVAVRPAGQP